MLYACARLNDFPRPPTSCRLPRLFPGRNEKRIVHVAEKMDVWEERRGRDTAYKKLTRPQQNKGQQQQPPCNLPKFPLLSVSTLAFLPPSHFVSPPFSLCSPYLALLRNISSFHLFLVSPVCAILFKCDPRRPAPFTSHRDIRAHLCLSLCHSHAVMDAETSFID